MEFKITSQTLISQNYCAVTSDQGVDTASSFIEVKNTIASFCANKKQSLLLRMLIKLPFSKPDECNALLNFSIRTKRLLVYVALCMRRGNENDNAYPTPKRHAKPHEIEPNAQTPNAN